MDPDLSFSAGANSPECIVCGALCYTLGGLESLFLVMEHENILEASDESYEPPHHPTLNMHTPPSCPPKPPHPGHLGQAFIRCGLRHMMPLTVVMQRTVKPLLLRYRATLPHQRWRAVCMQTMRVTQAVIDAYGGPAECSKEFPADSGASDGMHGGDACGHMRTGSSESTADLPGGELVQVSAFFQLHGLPFVTSFRFVLWFGISLLLLP